MTGQRHDILPDVSLGVRSMEGHPTTAVLHAMRYVAVPHPHNDEQRMRATVTTAGSTRTDEKNVIIANLLIVELKSWCVRRPLDLY